MEASSVVGEQDPSPVPVPSSTQGAGNNNDHCRQTTDTLVHSREPAIPESGLEQLSGGKADAVVIENDLLTSTANTPMLREDHITTDDAPVSISPNRPPELYSLSSKFGLLSILYLVVGSFLILGSVGFLAFLWFGNWTNSTWHQITAQNWLTRLSTLCSLAMRTAISTQASVAASMLAGLALERVQVLLPDAASISTMRNSSTGPYWLLWCLTRAFGKDPRRWRKSLVPVMVLLLALTTLLIQFASTALLSDLGPGVVPGLAKSSTLLTHFVYNDNGTIPTINRGTTWNMKPPFYPTFAEYHEPAETTAQSDGISDTGLTLRAFLPFQDAQSRSFLRTYEGKALVFDSRVVCMRPTFEDQRVHLTGDLLAFTGRVRAGFNVSRLLLSSAVSSTDQNFNSGGLNFSCLATSFPSTSNWALSFCQLGRFAEIGQLVSEFRTPTARREWSGSAYLVLNVSQGSFGEWASSISSEDPSYGHVSGPGTVPLFYSNRNEWLDLLFTRNASLRLSASLCYPAMDSADLSISASADSNRTEPFPTYNAVKGTYSNSAIRRQLGNASARAPQDRGVLHLHKRDSWFPGVDDYRYNGNTISQTTFVVELSNMGTSNLMRSGNSGRSFTAFLHESSRDENTWTEVNSIRADPSHISLVQETLQHGGSIAVAVQSLVTSLASIAYYDQLQQFNGKGNVSRTDFVIVTVPKGYRGFFAVVAVTFVHAVLLAIVTVLFMVSTTASSTGNAWQTIAQLRGSGVDEIMADASLRSDKQVLQATDKSLRRRIVGVGRTADGSRAEIVSSERDMDQLHWKKG